jgi:hypothetical protein
MQMNPDPAVQRGRRSRVSTEQKLAILQQWQAGTPVAELCLAVYEYPEFGCRF